MKNFGGLDSQFTEYNTARVVVLPIPYDATSTWVKGAHLGPDAILEASENMELFDIETNSEPFRYGIYTAEKLPVEDLAPQDMVKLVEKEALTYLNNDKFLVSIGGEHSISIGLFYAFARKFDNLTIVQIDAHADMRDQYLDSKYNHACVMARAKEVAPVVQVGIRSMDKAELKNIDRYRLFLASDIHKSENWITRITDLLTENVYLTIDLDGFDPAYIPATGTPEPGGLDWYQVIELIEAITKKSNLVGLDVVELAPHPGMHAANFLAAKLIYKTLALKFVNNKK